MAKGKVVEAPPVMAPQESHTFLNEIDPLKGTPFETFALAKSVHLATGLDLLGSKTSLIAKRGNKLEICAAGVIATNSEGRKIMIWSSNIKGAELLK